MGVVFTDRLEFAVTHDMRVRLIAIAFLTGSGGSYARIARTLLEQAMASAIAALTPERRQAYDEIFGNVEISEREKKR